MEETSVTFITARNQEPKISTWRSCKPSHVPSTWSLRFELKDKPHRVIALSRGIAAYIFVVPNGKLSSGQRAKLLQRSNEAVAKVDLRLSHVP